MTARVQKEEAHAAGRVSPRPRWQRALNQRIERIDRQQELTQQYVHAPAHARSDPAVHCMICLLG
jgi:hypothetical protein